MSIAAFYAAYDIDAFDTLRRFHVFDAAIRYAIAAAAATASGATPMPA